MTIDMNKEYCAEEIDQLNLPTGTVLGDEAGDRWIKTPTGFIDIYGEGPLHTTYQPYRIETIPSESIPFPEPDWRTEGWTPTWIPVWVRGEKVSSTTTHLKMRRYGGGDLQCNYRDGAYLDEWSICFGTEPPISEKPKWNEDEAGVSLEEAKRIAKLLSEFEEQEN